LPYDQLEKEMRSFSVRPCPLSRWRSEISAWAAATSQWCQDTNPNTTFLNRIRIKCLKPGEVHPSMRTQPPRLQGDPPDHPFSPHLIPANGLNTLGCSNASPTSGLRVTNAQMKVLASLAWVTIVGMVSPALAKTYQFQSNFPPSYQAFLIRSVPSMEQYHSLPVVTVIALVMPTLQAPTPVTRGALGSGLLAGASSKSSPSQLPPSIPTASGQSILIAMLIARISFIPLFQDPVSHVPLSP
jgi:hypothetical protein